MNAPGSLFLTSLSNQAKQAIEPHLSAVDLPQSVVLHEVGDVIQTVYFLKNGLVSLVALLQTGESIEIAMVGDDGIIGGASALGECRAACRAVVQIAGSGFSVPAKTLRKLAQANASLRDEIFRHDQLIFIQTVQSTACISSHNVEARLARWLLRCRDLTRSNDLKLTQEFLADMLGVRRASVSVVAHTLQAAGFIKYSRGHIRIIDLEGLHEAACECYDTIRAAAEHANS